MERTQTVAYQKNGFARFFVFTFKAIYYHIHGKKANENPLILGINLMFA